MSYKYFYLISLSRFEYWKVDLNIGIFFTHDYSLKSWYETGTLDKELKIYRNLSKEYKVNFVFYTYGDSEDIKILPNETGMKVFPIYDKFKRHNNKYVRLLFTFFLPFRIKKYTQDIDIIQQHQLAGVWVSLIIKLLNKKPLYIRTGYDTYQFSLKENKPFLLILFYKFMTYCSLKYSDVYSVTSNSDIKFLEQNFITKPKKLVLRPNWVDGNKTSTSDRFSNKILSVGRLEKQKNYELLIKELKNTKGTLVLDIVGEGSLLESLQKLADENSVEVNFLGVVNNENLMSMYQHYKFYISTSEFEGNPKTILEAMVSGCVVIASEIPNHVELIDDGVNGFLFDLRSPNLQSLLQSIKDNVLIENISNKAVESIKSSHSINKISADYVNDYKALI